jgi:hypothetical protein
LNRALGVRDLVVFRRNIHLRALLVTFEGTAVVVLCLVVPRPVTVIGGGERPPIANVWRHRLQRSGMKRKVEGSSGTLSC